MKYFYKNKRALSLTELLVASALMGIVMAGVAAFSVSMKQVGESTSRATILSMQTAVAMNLIVNDASQAVGQDNDRGVVTGSQGQLRSICFRHDGGDPEIYTDDTWECYVSDNQQRLYQCAEPPAFIPPAVNFNNDCDDGNGAVSLVQLSQPDFAQVVDDPVMGRFQYINIFLNTIHDRTQAGHPVTNPTYALSTRIVPSGHGR